MEDAISDISEILAYHATTALTIFSRHTMIISNAEIDVSWLMIDVMQAL